MKTKKEDPEKTASAVITLLKDDAKGLISAISEVAEDEGFLVTKSKSTIFIYKPTKAEKKAHEEQNTKQKEKIAGNLINKSKITLEITTDDCDYSDMAGVSAKEKKFYKIGSIKPKELNKHLSTLLKNTPFEAKQTDKDGDFYEIVMRGKKKFDFNFYNEFIELFKTHDSVREPLQLSSLIRGEKGGYYYDTYSQGYDINSYATPKGFFTLFLMQER